MALSFLFLSPLYLGIGEREKEKREETATFMQVKALPLQMMRRGRQMTQKKRFVEARWSPPPPSAALISYVSQYLEGSIETHKCHCALCLEEALTVVLGHEEVVNGMRRDFARAVLAREAPALQTVSEWAQP